MNELRCDKFTKPVPHEQNRPTQLRCNRQVTVSTLGKGISILYILNPFGECGLSMAKLLEKDNVVAEITYPFLKRMDGPPQYPIRSTDAGIGIQNHTGYQ